jgi:ABC-2 type transport system permease protein
MQQMSMLVGLPLIIAIIVLTVDTVNNPDSTLSFWLSMIPFTSPVVMMGRLAFGAPTGELIISIAILLITMIGMMWLAGKIYRGMILYTGKKVGVKDAIEWLQRSLTSKKNE